jgi:hypothetical protein
METPAKKENTTTPDSPSLYQRVMKLLAYPVAIASGYWAASTRVHNDAYNQAKRLGVFNDVLKDMTPKSEAVVQNRIDNKITVEKFTHDSMELKGEYQRLADARLKHVGLDTFRKKWNYMEKSSKQVAIIEGLTVFGIAIGAMLTMGESKALSKIFSKKEKSDSEPNR